MVVGVVGGALWSVSMSMVGVVGLALFRLAIFVGGAGPEDEWPVVLGLCVGALDASGPGPGPGCVDGGELESISAAAQPTVPGCNWYQSIALGEGFLLT